MTQSKSRIKNQFKIPKNQLKYFAESINYVDVHKLKDFLKKHNLSVKGKKGDIVERIKIYVLTGKKIDIPPIPEISKGINKNIELTPNTKILYGEYKNDLKTKLFMKTLVGEHFHFSAYGQDWMMQKWRQGNPPTYQEFANFWQQQYILDKKTKANPKAEWALLNFIQRYLDEHPKANRTKIMEEWKKEKSKREKYVLNILQM